jgi:hypothetical protein
MPAIVGNFLQQFLGTHGHAPIGVFSRPARDVCWQACRSRRNGTSEPRAMSPVNHKRSHRRSGPCCGKLPKYQECWPFLANLAFAVPQYGQDDLWWAMSHQKSRHWVGDKGGLCPALRRDASGAFTPAPSPPYIALLPPALNPHTVPTHAPLRSQSRLSLH